MKSPKWFLSSFNRSNLQYEVREKKGGKTAVKEIIDLIRGQFSRVCGIVYCLSRKECDSVAESLSGAGLAAISYHGMKS